MDYRDSTFWGFTIAWIGMYMGFVCSRFIKEMGKRVVGMMVGCAAGFMISIVCFDLIPDSFEQGSLRVTLFGVGFGLLIAAVIDGKLRAFQSKILKKQTKREMIIVSFLTMGLAIDNFPTGIALGTLAIISYQESMNLAVLLLIGCIFEGLVLGIFLRKSKTSYIYSMLLLTIIALPMGLGSIVGSAASRISPIIIGSLLSFAAGIILYITCGAILPETKNIWNGRRATLAILLGILIGFTLITFIH